MTSNTIETDKNHEIRILLVYSSEILSKMIDSSLRVAPIGLFFINGHLLSRGYQTRIINLIPSQFDDDYADSEAYKAELWKEIAEFDPHYIGYSFRNLFHWGGLTKQPTKLISYLSMYLEKPTVDFLRQITSAPIVGGGSAFSLASNLYMKYLGLDFGIVGEGELAFEQLFLALEAKRDVSGLPGLVYRKNDETLVNNPIEIIGDLAGMPAMQTGDMPDYRKLYYEHAGYGSIQTKRGCAFRCIYCQYPYLEGRNYRLRNIDTIMEEIRSIRDAFDIRHFFIVDSVFSTPVEQSVAFCNALIEKKLDIKWAAYINPRGLTRQVLETYKKSGCHNLVFTPDTLSSKLLGTYKKEFTIERVKSCIEMIREVGIPFEVSVILGGPGEDESTVDEAVEFCDRYLKDIPVVFFDGMWLHPAAPAMESVRLEGLFDGVENLDFDSIILGNDFATNSKLNYFFPHVTSDRRAFLDRIHSKLRKYKRIVVGKDSILDPQTGIVKHSPELGIIEDVRPWHLGMTGRQTANNNQ